MADNNPPIFTTIKITREEAPFLMNVLCDNARPWNARLRERLAQETVATDLFVARYELISGKKAPNIR